jgi:hypothetical protein
MGDLAQVAIEIDEASGQILESTVGDLPLILQNERVHLLLEETNVGGERENVLDRPVVEIEPETHQTTLRCRHERPLARARVLEEMLSLDDRAHVRGSLGEKRVCDVELDRSTSADDRRVRLSEAYDRGRSQLRATEEGEP